MLIQGLNKTTLLDFPGHVAATVFTPGCNMRCPFCHNADMVNGTLADIGVETILTFLEKRKKVLQGVCITGGEPTLQKELPEFIKRIKELGLLVKLDTNGTNPQMLKSLYIDGLLDYVAMDIKNSYEKYKLTAGTQNVSLDIIRESIFLIQNSEIPYEFRTTVVREFHEPEDIEAICREIHGAEAYYLQSYTDSDNILSGEIFHPWDPLKLKELVNRLQKQGMHIETRGIE